MTATDAGNMTPFSEPQIGVPMLHFHIADDHPLFRSALLDVINQHFIDAEITESSDLDTTLAALEQHADVDLLLLDINMPGSQDLFGLVSVREKYPSVPVAMVSASEDPDTISKAIGHGASAYIPKSVSPRDIYQALNAVIEGDKWVPEAVRRQLKPVDDEEKTLAAKIATLTPQQYKVLCYLREGLLNKQIGYELGVTEATVKAHITAIFRKLGVSNRTQAVIVLGKMSLEEV